METNRSIPARTQWGLVALLVIVMTISFIDRGNLSVAAPAMVAEMKISAWAMGLLLSAFFWTYAVFQIVSGWLSDRFEVRWVYASGFLVWTLATLSTGLVSAFALFLVCRLFLGIGESVTYPATSRILAAVVPEKRRGLANSLVDLGARVGPAAGILLGARCSHSGEEPVHGGRYGERAADTPGGVTGDCHDVVWLAVEEAEADVAGEAVCERDPLGECRIGVAVPECLHEGVDAEQVGEHGRADARVVEDAYAERERGLQPTGRGPVGAR